MYCVVGRMARVDHKGLHHHLTPVASQKHEKVHEALILISVLQPPFRLNSVVFAK